MTGDEDSSVFRAAMRDVKPIAVKERAAPTRRKRPKRVAARSSGGAARQAVDRRMLRDLARGRYRVEAETDLHGLSAAAAVRVLDAFIAEAVAQGLTCVRVVHGKGRRSGPGGPVLPTLVRRWLESSEHVLAVADASARDGGSGAACVLLER